MSVAAGTARKDASDVSTSDFAGMDLSRE